MSTPSAKSNHRLLIQTGGLFTRPHEWAIVDFVYWKSNTQIDRRWTCRMLVIQRYTPVKRIGTIMNVLDRLCKRGMGFSKVPFGEPQLRRCGDGLTAEPQQSHEYVFDAKVFDAWLKSQPPLPPIRKRIDPYPKADSQLSENGQQSYPKADTTIRKEEGDKKEIKEAVGSQPPFSTAVAPETEDLGEAFMRYFNDGLKSQPPPLKAAAPKPQEPEDLAEKFESFFKGTALASTSSVSPPDGPQPAEGGVPVGVPSTAVAPCPDSTIIQSASGTVNGSGTSEPDGAAVSVSAVVVQGSDNGNTNAAAEHDSAGQS